MKVIDKTPFQNDKGEIGLLERLQGTLKYGFSWYPELEAQKTVIPQLDRALEKGFVLIRNFTLPGSEITLPIILIGPPGVYVIHVTHLTGTYEAKGDQWGTANNGRFTPSPINLMSRVAAWAKVLQKYLDKQGISLPKPIEPILIASSPAMHIDSTRPVVRVVLSDAIKQFAASLLQAPPLIRTELAYDLADRIISPRPKAAPQQPTPAAPEPGLESQAPSRAQAIFNSQDVKPFNPNDIGFAFEEPAEQPQPQQQVPQNLREPSPAQPLRPAKPKQQRIMGMTMTQLAILGGILLCWFCIMSAGIYFILTQH